MSDEPENVIQKELSEANRRLAINVDKDMPLDITLRTIALTVAQRHVGDTVVREGGLYQQLKMDQKTIRPVEVQDVLNAALVFERYLWGEFSKGLAENAIKATASDLAEEIERQFDARIDALKRGEGQEDAT